MTRFYSEDLHRWVRVRVLGLRENGNALVHVLDGEYVLVKTEVPVFRLRAS